MGGSDIRHEGKFSKVLLGLALCLMTVAQGCVSQENPEPSITIRSTAGEELISNHEILGYRWSTHTMTLKSGVHGKLEDKLLGKLVSGQPFELWADGKPIFHGTMTTSVSSFSFATVVVVLGPHFFEPILEDNQVRFDLGYPTEDFFKGDDPRGNEVLREALRKSGRLD